MILIGYNKTYKLSENTNIYVMPVYKSYMASGQ